LIHGRFGAYSIIEEFLVIFHDIVGYTNVANFTL
jgi:hypothetical protein